ncbi:MAG: hypothetical protein ACRD2I_20700 [Vicinamibacterales bacterium]
MSPLDGEPGFERAQAIIAGSRVAISIDAILVRALAAANDSRVLAAVRRRIHAWQRLSAGEQGQCALVMIGTAVAAHIVMAAMLPAAARPQVALTALLLLALGLGALAIGARRS